ncbi:MAG: TolC family protein [Ignavibacteriae bacterium]|nr:TolC family protein [Ignavibacteriota bacterium]
MRNIFLLFTVILFLNEANFSQQKTKNIIELSFNEVIGISKSENLSLKSKLLEYEYQNLEEWKSYSNFLPSLTYQGLATNNLELPVFVFMGQKFTVGTKFAFQHSLDLSLPIFTGGSRWFNLKIQKNIRKSLSEELKGKEQEVVLQSLQAFYGIILTNSLFKTASEAVEVSKQNLDQVKKYYEAGTATELDWQRAKAQYAASLPNLEKAKSEKLLGKQRLKFLLNISLDDSLVITDSLDQIDFLNNYKNSSLEELKKISEENRFDIKSLQYKLAATKQGENIALGSFTPIIAASANLGHQAQLENSHVMWNDYIRSKSISLSMIWPLFEGGKKILNYQQAKIQTEQMEIMLEQADKGRILNVEENYYIFSESVKNLESLKEAMIQSKESLRLSNLLYAEGMSTQLDVLNAQLLNTTNQTQYFQGIFNYNVSQLNLLYSMGVLNEIWE